PDLRRARARARSARSRRAPRPDRRAGRCRRAALRASSRSKPGGFRAAPAPCRAAVARRFEGRLAAGPGAPLESSRRWRRLVLAGGREGGAAGPAGKGAAADSLRPAGARPAPLRALVGVGLPIRSLHAGAETPARLLRSPAPLARPR